MFNKKINSNKPYEKVKAYPQKSLLHSEVNEIQDIFNTKLIRANRFCGGDGPYGDGFSLSVKDMNTLTVNKGMFVHRGQQLYLDQNVDITYSIPQLVLGEDYILVCNWSVVNIDEKDDPNIRVAKFGTTSHRSSVEMVFSIEREDTALDAVKNTFIISKLNFRDDGSSLLPLEASDLEDRRLNYSVHYVNEVLSIDFSNITNMVGYSRIILSEGNFSYLGSTYTPDDISERTFDVPLPTVGSIARYLLYYYVDEFDDIYPAVANYADVQNLDYIPLKLYEVSADHNGILLDTINSIKQFEPVSRTVARNSFNNLVSPQTTTSGSFGPFGDTETTQVVDFNGTNSFVPNGWKMVSKNWDYYIRENTVNGFYTDYSLEIDVPFDNIFVKNISSTNSFYGVDVSITLENNPSGSTNYRLVLEVDHTNRASGFGTLHFPISILIMGV